MVQAAFSNYPPRFSQQTGGYRGCTAAAQGNAMQQRAVPCSIASVRHLTEDSRSASLADSVARTNVREAGMRTRLPFAASVLRTAVIGEVNNGGLLTATHFQPQGEHLVRGEHSFDSVD